MSDADYEYEDICLCRHSFHDHKYQPADQTLEPWQHWGRCEKCDCQVWRQG
jgi:hypothetical protein